MTFFKTYSKAVLFLVAALISCGGSNNDQLDLPEEDYAVHFDVSDERVVGIAVVGGMKDSLMLNDLDQRLGRIADLAPDLMSDPAQSRKMKKEILDNFLQNHVLDIESETRKLEVEEDLVQSEVSAYKNRLGDDGAFQRELNSMGFSESEFVADTRRRIKQKLLMERFREEVAAPSASEIDQFISQQQESRRLAHILFSFDRVSSKEELDQMQKLAMSVLDSLANGADFSELAILHSDDGSSRQGGDLGFVERGQMVDAFEDAAFNLQNTGDITTGLIKTAFGLHIIKFLSAKTNPPMDKEEASETLVKKKRHDAVNEQIRILKSNAELHLNPEHISEELFK